MSGGGDRAALATLDNLAHVFQAQGRHAEAEEWFGRALAGRPRVLGDSRLDTSESLGNLAALYYAQGRYAAAVPLYEESLAVRRRRAVAGRARQVPGGSRTATPAESCMRTGSLGHCADGGGVGGVARAVGGKAGRGPARESPRRRQRCGGRYGGRQRCRQKQGWGHAGRTR